MTPSNTYSYLTSKVIYQLRVKEQDNPMPVYRLLLSNLELDANKPLNVNIPPITYESAIYFDVIDCEGNF